MTRKNFDLAVQQAVKNQGEVSQNQFDMTESILLKANFITPDPVPKKSYVERAIFSMPPSDLALIDVLRARASSSVRMSPTKSEIVRAGLHALSALEGPAFLEILDQLQKVRRGN